MSISYQLRSNIFSRSLLAARFRTFSISYGIKRVYRWSNRNISQSNPQWQRLFTELGYRPAGMLQGFRWKTGEATNTRWVQLYAIQCSHQPVSTVWSSSLFCSRLLADKPMCSLSHLSHTHTAWIQRPPTYLQGTHWLNQRCFHVISIKLSWLNME